MHIILLILVIVGIIIHFLSSMDTERLCPYCKDSIPNNATKCSHCQSDVEPVENGKSLQGCFKGCFIIVIGIVVLTVGGTVLAEFTPEIVRILSEVAEPVTEGAAEAPSDHISIWLLSPLSLNAYFTILATIVLGAVMRKKVRKRRILFIAFSSTLLAVFLAILPQNIFLEGFTSELYAHHVWQLVTTSTFDGYLTSSVNYMPMLLLDAFFIGVFVFNAKSLVAVDIEETSAQNEPSTEPTMSFEQEEEKYISYKNFPEEDRIKISLALNDSYEKAIKRFWKKVGVLDEEKVKRYILKYREEYINTDLLEEFTKNIQIADVPQSMAISIARESFEEAVFQHEMKKFKASQGGSK